ncbi:MAG: VOC family protein [Chloroflexia bacterium]|nr:VOC family protein [Chloroflexia bacterium]
MPNTFDWIEIRTRDAAKTARFYEHVFGWRVTKKLEADGTAVWLFDTGDEPRLENLRRGGIWARPSADRLGIVVYILVDDIEATLEKVAAMGGEVVRPKAPQGSSCLAFFADPSGNILGLWEE